MVTRRKMAGRREVLGIEKGDLRLSALTFHAPSILNHEESPARHDDTGRLRMLASASLRVTDKISQAKRPKRGQCHHCIIAVTHNFIVIKFLAINIQSYELLFLIATATL